MAGSDDNGPEIPERDGEIHQTPSEDGMTRADPERRLRWRRVLTVLLVVLTSVSVVSSAIAVWAHQVVFDTDRFMSTVDGALDDPNLYILLADEATASVLEALDIQDRLTERLGDLDAFISDALLDAIDVDEAVRERLQGFDRPSLGDLAPPIATALEDRIDSAIQSFFSSREFRSRSPELIRRVHEAAVALVREDLTELPNVYVEDGEVRLNLITFVGEALKPVAEDIQAVIPDFDLPDAISDRLAEGRDQLESAIGARLPDDFGQVTIMSEDTLSEAQDVAAQLDRYAWLSLVVTLVLLVSTIAISPNRRVTLIHLGIGVFVAVVVAALTIRQLQSAIVDEIVDPRSSALADGIVSDVLSGLRTTEVLIAVAAILVALVAYLIGRPTWFVRLNDTTQRWTEPAEGGSMLDRWVARNAGPLRIAGVLIAAGVLFLVGLDLVSVIIVGLVLAGYLWAISSAAGGAESPDRVDEDQLT